MLAIMFMSGRAYAQGATDLFPGAAGVFGAIVLVMIGLLVLSIAMLVFVARDAKARGMDAPVLWMLVVFFLNLLGLVIYMLARPSGNTVRCANCGNKRLQFALKCPHCGIGEATPIAQPPIQPAFRPEGYCSNCGSPHAHAAQFCVGCGTALKITG
jgi:hypothetical protein